MELEATGVPVVAWAERIDQAVRIEVQRGTGVRDGLEQGGRLRCFQGYH